MGDFSPAIIYFVVLIGVFYFFLIRPQQKRDKSVKELRASLKVGDEVSTIGGIVGTVHQIKEDFVTLEVGPDKLKVKMMKWSIGSKVTKDNS